MGVGCPADYRRRHFLLSADPCAGHIAGTGFTRGLAMLWIVLGLWAVTMTVFLIRHLPNVFGH
jgi:hypothetical protein